MNNHEYIDSYFAGKPSADLKREFEEKIAGDQQFAEEVAFYISAKDVITAEVMDEKKARLRKLYDDYKKTNPAKAQKSIIVKLWPYVAAAAIVIGVIVGRNLFFQSSPQQIADKFMQQNFTTLPVTMGTADSLQAGIQLYNQGKLAEALNQFEAIIRSDTSSIEAKKYAGIVSLRLTHYDKAANYFTQLENYSLYSNPGKLYHALALIKSNRPGDMNQIKKLLQQVVQLNLEGRETAEQLLNKQ